MMEVERTPAETIEQAQRQQRAIRRRIDVHKDKVHYSEKSWRTASLHPDYEAYADEAFFHSMTVINVFTGIECTHKSKWNHDETILICLYCFIDCT